MEILSLVLSIIFIILALIHFNWAIGGKWGFDNALPTNGKGYRLFTPRRIDSLIVGSGLLTFSLYYFTQTSFIQYDFPIWAYKYGGWIIPFIFTLRVIGDFKYVGIFKKIRDTTFGKYDSKFFIPICLVIAIFGFLVRVL